MEKLVKYEHCENKKLLSQTKVHYFSENSVLVLTIEFSSDGNRQYVVQAIDDNPLYREVFNLDNYNKALEAFNIRKNSYRPDFSSELLKHIGPKNFIFKSRGVSAKLKVAEAKIKFPPSIKIETDK